MTPAVLERLAKLDTLHLEHGAHDEFNKGVCAMEAVAWLAGEEHTDAPECASKALTTFMQRWNDTLDDEGRQKLKPFLPRIIGTRDDGHDETRGWMCADWLIRTFSPAWLELAGLTESAAALRALPELRTDEQIAEARPAIRDARKAGLDHREAARRRLVDKVRAASGAAYGAASGAAYDAAYGAAYGAAYDAAYGAARKIAREAADPVLAPTKVELQASALDLLERMVSLGEDEREAKVA